MTGTMAASRLTVFRAIGWLAVAAMLAVAILGPSAQRVLGASVAPVTSQTYAVLAGNPTCDDIDGTFAGAKKGAVTLGKLSAGRGRRSWQLQTATVFLSPLAQQALRPTK